MPFVAPSLPRLPPLAFLLADQMESRKNIARQRGVSLRTCSATKPPATHPEPST
ncbi:MULTISPECIES: hypothetical protein [unclassified Variovorax]|uniref:hypothetical protein n=1 Tax=unclassified Variovorax TaxID=663243 RepID=UPI00076BE856|nr:MULTISPECIES: hypothetical protein [unclassified Variovorax]KWT98553.1 hypothetical protein APY03_0351 [Variovorax sp. WDL1]PNG46119.1 hypothetical protein CHC06_08097 [Variovorax sp. B2]PNG46222.1 hypothetical protein CHC07_07970 [Variovorax sp. B4]VTV19243.1 hypothetical protein WDL1P3_00170 [Variovorax sp. WDL1]